ncbi:MAG: YheT family hydrolase [Bdellovibrionales bacterium]
MGIEDRVERVLKKLKLNKFYPFPFARSGFLQTIYGVYWPILKPSKPDHFHHLVLPDGDVLVVAENRPKNWQPGGRIMLLVHGVTGCYESTYMQRMCRRLCKKGYMVMRLNLRFCGPGKGLARRPYHAGVSDDTRYVIEWLKKQYPQSPVTQVGFSLGGNVTLKMAGEMGSRPVGNLDSAVAVSAPVDLAAAAARMDEPDNRLFQRSFLSYLVHDVKLMEDLYPEVGRTIFAKDLTIRKFDEVFAAPRSGFSSVEEYYETCSSVHYIPEIKIPTLILAAMDDPVVNGQQIAEIPHRSNLDVLLTEHGGHMGFLGWGTKWDEVRWCDQAVDRWMEDTLAI